MRTSENTQNTPFETDIIAQPPFGSGPPFDPKQPLPISRTRVRIGLFLLLSTFAIGVASSFFPAAKLWLFAGCALLVVCTFWILGLHRLRFGRGRDPRKLYGRQRI